METSSNKHTFRMSWLSLIPHLILTAVFIGFFTGIAQILRILTNKLEIEDNMLHGTTGILNRDVQSCSLNHIQSVRVDRSLFGRIFRYGNIRITTAGDGFVYKGMADPERIRNTINSHIR